MANLQIKGIDNESFEELRKFTAEENGSISKETLFLVILKISPRQELKPAQ